MKGVRWMEPGCRRRHCGNYEQPGHDVDELLLAVYTRPSERASTVKAQAPYSPCDCQHVTIATFPVSYRRVTHVHRIGEECNKSRASEQLEFGTHLAANEGR